MGESVLDVELTDLEGVGPATARKLREAGVLSIMDLAVALPTELEDAGLTRETAGALIFVAQRKLREGGVLQQEFVPAAAALERRRGMLRCSTGASNLDQLLKGGVETQAITEFWGEFGSGKSQICHTLTVMAQLHPQKGGLGGAALYVDAENTFRPERIAEIAEARGLESETILANVFVSKAYNSSHLELVVRSLGNFIEKYRARLVVVDSVISLHRAEFLGRGTLAERQQRLNSLIHRLLRVAEVYNIAVVITNQVQQHPDIFFGDPNRPTGGHVIAHAATYRLMLRKSRNYRIATMVDSPYHPTGDAIFAISPKGIEDYEPTEHRRGAQAEPIEP
jgi:DNA repair protein RadA